MKSQPTKTMLTISMGFLIIYLIGKIDWAIYVSVIIGLTGVFSTYLSKKIEFLWMKLSWVLSLIIPNILLSIIFYIFLFPIALISKISRSHDPLLLKNKRDSTFMDINKNFEKSNLENPW